jgi:glycerol-3-phosphate dehydrogenase (NAD(P)+)
MEKRVLVVGAGELGGALGVVLRSAAVSIEMWDKDVSKTPDRMPLSQCVPSADFIFLCVPSSALREALTATAPYVRKEMVVFSLSKGIEEQTLKTPAELLEELLPNDTPRALLAGPMLAEELVQGMVGIGVVATKDKSVFDRTRALFGGTKLRLEYSDDVSGVALASVLKNIYAIGLGIAQSLRLGDNFKGWFVNGAVKEMAHILKLLGGREETAFGSAGLADLITTGLSPHSRNYRIGDELAQTGACNSKSEGIVSLPSVRTLLGERAHSTPLFSALDAIIFQHKNAREVFQGLEAMPE